ncbi:sensor domain-containing diguanylate cyclase [Paraglaciecola sp.]|uniref:sensor domain-containing diguanylate cyclase n=1 Tax=Paraglaciecola sp. TaxID=1920173 RepID=UPI003EF8DC28
MFNIKEMVSAQHLAQRAVWSKSLSVVLFIMTLLIFLPLVYHFSIALQPAKAIAKNGQILIQSNDYSIRETLALDGDWLFFWQALLTPEQISKKSHPHSIINAGGGWQADKYASQYKAIGFATYQLNVELEQYSNNLALYIPPIESAYKLFINNDLEASGGVLSTTEQTAKPGYKTEIIRVPDNIKRFTITVQVSNFNSSWGGLWEPIVLGDANALHTIQRDQVALSMFILGALLITIIHSLIQYFLRPTDNIPLVFSCLCLLLFLRELTVEHMSFILSSLSGGFVLITKLNFFSYYAGFPAALYFFHLCYGQEFNKRFCSLIYSICLPFSAFVLLFPTQYLGLSTTIFQVIALVIMSYILYRTWVATQNKRRGAGIMLAGSLFAFTFAFNDILNMNNVIDTGRFFSLGIIGFIMCQSFVTNGRFDNFIDKNATLTEELKERNSDLELMSKLLETKVEQRTQQLQKANAELNTLANHDPLTNAYNRHGIQQHIQGSFERYRRTQEPFSLLLIDYDHFKEINDNYGHDVGDLVLMTGADLIKNVMREQDKLARWGGEEFLILLPGTTIEGATAIGEKLRLAINEKPIGQPLGIKVSITAGIAQVNISDSFDTMFKRADDALYKGKKSGRNQICV